MSTNRGETVWSMLPTERSQRSSTSCATCAGPTGSRPKSGLPTRHRRDAGPFQRYFPAPLRFDAERNAVVFAAAWLRRPVLQADQELRREIQEQIDALEARHDGEFPAQVRGVLSSVLLTDDASVERVAALFSMHSRTFNRRLAAYGTCFKELADESRFELARQMLEESSYAVGDVADTLGYADASAFIRAFRRWAGTTPAQWRARRAARARRR